MAYLGNWPGTQGFQSIDFGSKTQTRITETQSGRTVRFSTATNRFAVRIRYPSLTAAEFRPIQAFATRCNGSLNSFDITLPTVADTTSGYPSQTVKVSAAHSAGDSAISINSDQTSATILKAGDIVRFENHTKVYMVTQDVASDGSGDATMNIFPNLIEALEDDSAGGNTSVTINQVPIRMFIDGDVQTYKHATDETITAEFDLIEEI